MKNPKTTILGVLTLLGAIVTVGTALVQGHPIDFATVGPMIVSGLAGVGLIHASDGSM